MESRVRLLYERRRALGKGHTDQLRLWHEKPAAPLCRTSGSPRVIDVILRALYASPEIWLEPLPVPETHTPPTTEAGRRKAARRAKERRG